MARERIGFLSRLSSKFLDNAKLFFGDSANADDPTQGDASIHFDATRLVISPAPAGGVVHIGDSADTVKNEVHIFDGGTDKPGAIALYDGAGGIHYLWVHSDNKLYTSTAIANGTAGTVVGTQS